MCEGFEDVLVFGVRDVEFVVGYCDDYFFFVDVVFDEDFWVGVVVIF